MRRTRSKQIMTIAVIMVAVVGLSIGFAVFSANLSIQSGANITPNSGDFKVRFSSSADSYSTAPITPVISPSGAFEATNATIDTENSTTISNLSASFTEPGQSATYTFYVRNDGKYKAWLHNITFGKKTCEVMEGATYIPQQSLMDAACDDIELSLLYNNVVISSEGYYDDYMSPAGKTPLPIGSIIPITITLKYADNGARADGDFSVNFGDIEFTYKTTEFVTIHVTRPH